MNECLLGFLGLLRHALFYVVHGDLFSCDWGWVDTVVEREGKVYTMIIYEKTCGAARSSWLKR